MTDRNEAASQSTLANGRSNVGGGEVSDDTNVQGVKKPGRLMTFRAPQPSQRLIRFLIPVNRWLNLGGIPGLRSLPLLGRVPGIRGLVDIPVINFPASHEKRLADATSPDNACFIVPNHPEFFTDWMLDKEIMTRVALRTASWATHSVVNGMGEFAQNFWLKNNLIAQIPGAGGEAGKAYSIDWALKGHCVLLHPEGGVGWHGDLIAPLFPGAVDMAMAAAKRGEGRRAMVAPVVWKLKFNRNVERGLHRELDYVENSLALGKSSHDENPAARLFDIYSSLLARVETRYGVHPSNDDFFDRQDQLIAKICGLLGGACDRLEVEGVNLPEHDISMDQVAKDLMRGAERWLRGTVEKNDDTRSVRTLIKDLRQLRRMHREIYRDSSLTQEHVAESIKRIRNDYCSGSWRDGVNQFLPQPVGPRTAIIRVPEPLNVGEMMATMSSAEMVSELEARMQAALDDINRDLAEQGELISYSNPFIA